MRYFTFLLFAFLITLSIDSTASDLKIQNVRSVARDGVQNTPVSVIFDISWKNSWKNNKNHDAVWIFMKYSTPWNNHVKISPDGHQVLKNRSGTHFTPTIEISEDGMGFYIYSTDSFRGDIDCKIQIMIDSSGQQGIHRKLRGLQVHGIEMVYIPEGSFTVGSPDQEAISRAAFYKSDDAGKPDGLFTINSEQEINVGPNSNSLYYWSESELYNGDQKGPIPAAFPKGYDPFYIMKYELTQGQYADFLNDLPSGWTYTRSPTGGKDYYKKRGGIKIENGKYVAVSPDRPMNLVSFTDGLAYSDWAALRPLTELEYEKAARGTAKPKDAEFPWGTSDYDQLERYVDRHGELIIANEYDESSLSDETRSTFGASYYWVMDLSGSVWEKVITIGNEIGRAFQGSHGDGSLDFGHATNEDWPSSDDEKGGFGYRGGGYYEVGTIYSDFNPYSPIGYRYYGSWSGGPRSIAYGYRAARSAK